MNKAEFLLSLEKLISGFPAEDIKEYKEYYSEMIDDRVEEGLSEEEAVADIGTPQDVASKIISESSIPKLLKTKFSPKRKLKKWETVLIIVGSPVWGALAIGAVAIIIAILAAVVSVVISLYAAAVTFIASALVGILALVANIITGNIPLGLAYLGSGLFLSGVGILMFIALIRLTKCILSLSKKLIKTIKIRLIGKEDAI